MTRTLFSEYNIFLKKHFSRPSSQRTFNNFLSYCKTGITKDGVKPIVNPINLYAFGAKITSKQALSIYRKRKESL